MEKDEGARHAELDLGPHLSAGQRAIAPLLHQALQEVAAHFSAGEDVEIHAAGAARRLREQGFSSVDYLEVHDSKTLALLARADGRAARVFGAARLGTVRLIDNVAV
jgi:pantoate--beta-alanine ligase